MSSVTEARAQRQVEIVARYPREHDVVVASMPLSDQPEKDVAQALQLGSLLNDDPKAISAAIGERYQPQRLLLFVGGQLVRTYRCRKSESTGKASHHKRAKVLSLSRKRVRLAAENRAVAEVSHGLSIIGAVTDKSERDGQEDEPLSFPLFYRNWFAPLPLVAMSTPLPCPVYGKNRPLAGYAEHTNRMTWIDFVPFLDAEDRSAALADRSSHAVAFSTGEVCWSRDRK